MESFYIPRKGLSKDIIQLTYIMSLSTLRGNFKTADTERGKVHEQSAIPFVPEEESTTELDK
eukprot:14043716-Ditylum_brightwellii.AAC.1